ncbi:MAG TPA: hypothetical protein VLM37_03190 [Fibrobacteraceae bacterium]|nr:hypothetical protein [Fibrobacteraceae bacterium]
MKRCCPNPACHSTHYSKSGSYHRPSDGRNIQRYVCKDCGRRFSDASGKPAFGQKRRRLNHQVYALLCSGVSLRRTSLLLCTTRVTVERKLRFMAAVCAQKNERFLNKIPLVSSLQFDELETLEHSRCKPLSVAMAVEKGSRRILGIAVSSMRAKGLLAARARAQYGPRADKRRVGLKALLRRIVPFCSSDLSVQTDECPFYVGAVRRVLGSEAGFTVRHIQYKGAKGCVTGQGELKKLGYDPLFSVNHTFAMLRANVNRLFRRTWCTTKRMERLLMHLTLYMHYHNTVLLPNCGNPQQA